MSRTTRLSGAEFRALQVLRRAGSLGILRQHLLRRMRPGSATSLAAALDRLAQGGYVAVSAEPRFESKEQTVFRITPSGRALLDGRTTSPVGTPPSSSPPDRPAA